jgi:HEAT repeat protein
MTVAPRPGIAQNGSNLPSSTEPSLETDRSPLEILQEGDAGQELLNQAASRLVAAHDPATRPQIVRLLAGGSSGTKLALAQALGLIGWPEEGFLGPLISMLRGRDVADASAAALALSQYQGNKAVLQELIAQSRPERPDVRPSVIRALGTFLDKPAAETLISLMERDPDDAIREAAGDALIEMTGLAGLDHNAAMWAQWWDRNGNLPDDQFRGAVITSRGQAFEGEFGQHQLLETAADELLRADFWNAVPDKDKGETLAKKRASILLSYLRSPAPEIRALGAELVYASASSTGAAPAGSIELTRLLLEDASPEVRAAAAKALSADVNSAAALVAQLAREQDDLVRVRLIQSLAPFHDLQAITQMLKLLGPGVSDPVRIAAAEAIREGSDELSKDEALKAQAIAALKGAMQGTDVPGKERVRAAIVGALAAIRDNSMADFFRGLLAGDEPVAVRASALIGLGNLPDSAPYAAEIVRHLDDNDSPQMRLAAITALRQPPAPLPIAYVSKLLSMMFEDSNDQVRAAAWDELQHWAQLPQIDETALSAMADGLKTQPAKELVIRQRLTQRLAEDVKNGGGEAGHPAAQELAEQRQTVGDLLMNPAVDRPLAAAEAYRAALDYWSSNQGSPNVISSLCGDIVNAYLEARHWDDAASFAAGIVKKYGKDPNLMVTSQTVARQFVAAAGNLEESTDPNAYSDAMALFDAVAKMDPPLPPDYPDQLASRRAAIEAKHAASSKPSQ